MPVLANCFKFSGSRPRCNKITPVHFSGTNLLRVLYRNGSNQRQFVGDSRSQRFEPRTFCRRFKIATVRTKDILSQVRDRNGSNQGHSVSGSRSQRFEPRTFCRRFKIATVRTKDILSEVRDHNGPHRIKCITPLQQNHTRSHTVSEQAVIPLQRNRTASP